MTEFKTWHFSYIGRNATNKQDKGLRISVDELRDLIEGNKLLPWIELNICSLDFWDSDARRVMDVEFTSIASCYDFGIESDGMARLIAYCFAFIDNLTSRTIEDI